MILYGIYQHLKVISGDDVLYQSKENRLKRNRTYVSLITIVLHGTDNSKYRNKKNSFISKIELQSELKCLGGIRTMMKQEVSCDRRNKIIKM